MTILAIVIIARTFATFFSHGVLRLCCLKSRTDVGFRELIFICYGGMIRGAIAFGLVLKIPTDPQVNPNKGIIVTTTLALVIITTVVFGSFMPIVQKCLFPVEDKDLEFEAEIPETSAHVYRR
jgi:NhaP-type Na+/H+ or K+/H+ antiporter